MKLLMPNKQRPETHAELEWIHALRNTVQQAARRLDCTVEECEYDVFLRFAFVAEAYRFALFHVLFADDTTACAEYLENCCKVFRGEMEEMEFVDGGLPEYVRNGFDAILEEARQAMLVKAYSLNQLPGNTTIH